MSSVIYGLGFAATGVLLGAMLFFSGVVAPLVFVKLDGAVAAKFIRQVFPWYYLVVILVSGGAALALAAFCPWEALALAGVCGAGLLARQVLMPAINRARDAGLAGDEAAGRRFSRLHRLSVWINAAQMLTATVVLASLIPPPP